MIVPTHWAESRKRHRAAGKQITVRRYGWSATCEADALANAQARADEALRRIVAGEKLDRREPKVPYNGAAGVPIREEVLSRHGEQVILAMPMERLACIRRTHFSQMSNSILVEIRDQASSFMAKPLENM